MALHSNRRQLLLAGGYVATVAIAGCLGDDDPPADDGAVGSDDDNGAVGSGDDGEDEPSDGNEASDPGGVADGEGFPIEGDFELPTDPDEGDFVDATGEDVVEVETIQREEDPQFVFDPPFVRVDEGTTIRWVNADGVFHTITSTDSLDGRSPSGTFDATISAEGDEFEWEAEESGIHHYYCSPHVGFMYGSIEVV